jgi:hypothetical protein
MLCGIKKKLTGTQGIFSVILLKAKQAENRQNGTVEMNKDTLRD